MLSRQDESTGRTVLVVGNYRPSLMVVRSLAKAGYRVVVGGGGNRPIVELSRYAAETWEHPRIEGGGTDFIDALEQCLSERPDISFVYPISEHAVVCLCRHLHRLPARVKAVMAPPSVVETCLDKPKMLKVAADLGIPQGDFGIVRSRTQLIDSADAIGYPCVVRPTKPLMIPFRKKASICSTAESIREQFRRWPETQETLLVQRYVPGDRHNLYFGAREGEILGGVEVKILRTDREDGTGLAVDGVSVEPTRAICEHSRKLLEQLKYTGVGCVQFIVSEQQACTPFFLEVNPRLGANSVIAQHCGLDLPVLALDLARGVHIEARDFFPPRLIGKRYAWTFGDLRGLLLSVRQGYVGTDEALRWFGMTLASFVRCDLHISWSWEDPLPTVATYLPPLGRLVRRLQRSRGTSGVPGAPCRAAAAGAPRSDPHRTSRPTEGPPG